MKEPSPYEASRDRRIRPIAKLLKSGGTWWKTTSALLASDRRTACTTAAALALIATGLVFGVAQTAPGWMVLDNVVRDVTARFAADTPSRAHPELAIISITDADLESRPFQRPVDRSLIGDLVTAADKSGAALIALVDPIEHATLPNADAALLASITTAKADVIAVVREDGEPFARSYLTGVQIALPGVPDTGSIALPPLPTRSEALAPRLAGSVLGRSVDTHHLGTPLDPVWRTDAGSPAILRLTVDEALNALDMDAQFLKDRIVLIGVDAASSWSSGAGISGSPILSRAEIVAQQTAQLLDGRHVETAPAWASWVLAAFAGLLAAALCTLSRSRWISVALTMVGVSSVCFAASVLLWSVFSLSLSPVAAVLGVAVTTFLCGFILGAHHRILRHRAKRTIGRRFGNSGLKPSAADKLLLGLDGETRVVSVLEMRGPSFAATADSRTASETLTALSAFCDGLTSIVNQFGGTIETLKPGRMTVVFGAPSLQPDHAMQALKAAREIADFCVRFGAQRASLGINAGAFRIGVHTGPATVGAFSASGDKNYAAVGLTPDTAD
ncbi:MAG: CHASE2 domain-containing protein, partial [Pseudomonadota bacterium]